MTAPDPLLEFAERGRRAQEAVNALGAGPPVPAQTITLSSDQMAKEVAERVKKEVAERVKKAMAGFRVYRSAYYVRLQHVPCLEVLKTTPETTLGELVIAAIDHDCPADLT